MGVTRSRLLVGRDTEVAELGDVWSRVRDGLPQVLVVRGEAGIGKTSLVRHWLRSLGTDESKTLVAWGHAVPLSGGDLPYGLVADLFTDLLTDLVSGHEAAPTSDADPADRDLQLAALEPLLPGLLTVTASPDAGRRGPASRAEQSAGSDGRSDAGEGFVDRLAVFTAAQQLVRRLARDRTLLLVVEDLHWADQASADLLKFLARTLPTAPVVLVATSRDHGVQEHVMSLIDSLERVPGATTLRLGPLDAAGLAAQVLDIAGQTSREVLARVASLSDGNPLFVEELLASGLDLVPSAVRVDLSVRLTAVPERSRHLLQVAALENRSFDPTDLAEVSETATDLVDAALDQAAQVGLLEPAGPTAWRFHHELLREAVAGTMPRSQIRAVHRRWGELFALRTGVEDAVAAAEHLRAAVAGREAFDAVVKAARMTERHQRGRESTHWWRRALALDDPVARVATATEHDEILGRILLASDRDARLEVLSGEEQSPQDASPLRRDWMRLERAELVLRHPLVSGTPMPGREVAALREHVENLPANMLTYRTLLAVFTLQRDREDDEELDKTLAAFRRLADTFPEEYQLGFGAYATAAEVAVRRGRGWEEVRASALQGLATVPTYRTGTRVMFETEIAGFEASLGRFDEAMERARACLAQIPGPEADERWYGPLSVLADCLIFRGAWEEARTWLDICVDQHALRYVLEWGLGQLGLLLAGQGRREELFDLIDGRVAREPWRPEDSLWEVERFVPRLLHAHAAAFDDAPAARRLLEPILTAPDVREVGFAAEACLLAAKLASIEPHREPVADDAYRGRIREAAADLLRDGPLEHAWLTEITIRLDAADREVGPETWHTCLDVWQGIGAPFRVAECSLDLAAAQLAAGDRGPAADALVHAWETASLSEPSHCKTRSASSPPVRASAYPAPTTDATATSVSPHARRTSSQCS